MGHVWGFYYDYRYIIINIGRILQVGKGRPAEMLSSTLIHTLTFHHVEICFLICKNDAEAMNLKNPHCRM